MAARLRQSAFNVETSDVWLALVTISHADLAGPIRRVPNTSDIVQGGRTFIGADMQVILPRDTDDGLLRGSITVDNTDQHISRVLNLSSAPDVAIEIVRAADPGTTEVSFPSLQVTDADDSGDAVVLQIGHHNRRLEPFPAHAMTPDTFPDLF